MSPGLGNSSASVAEVTLAPSIKQARKPNSLPSRSSSELHSPSAPSHPPSQVPYNSLTFDCLHTRPPPCRQSQPNANLACSRSFVFCHRQFRGPHLLCACALRSFTTCTIRASRYGVRVLQEQVLQDFSRSLKTTNVQFVSRFSFVLISVRSNT